jgi:hypothetical protein
VVNSTARSLLLLGAEPVLNIQEAGWAPGKERTGLENLAPTRIRSPERLVCRVSLYQVRYPGPLLKYMYLKKLTHNNNTNICILKMKRVETIIFSYPRQLFININ